MKTLKDIRKIQRIELEKANFKEDEVNFIMALFSKDKREAIEWIKEDLDQLEKDGLETITITQLRIIQQWIKRFNLTEEDLGEQTE